MTDQPRTSPGTMENALADVERDLALLGDALRRRDDVALERHSADLHRALVHAVQVFTDAARQGHVPLDLRERLGVATRLVAAHRESLARATAALDRAIEVLIPQDRPAVYRPRTGNPSTPAVPLG